MTLVQDVVKKNPLYDQGILFNSNFYKEQISSDQHLQEVDVYRETTFYYVTGFVEVAKKVALIGLVVIPSLAILGPYVFATVFLTGAAAGVMTEALTSDQSILKRMGYQAEINACIESAKAYIQPAIDFFSSIGLSASAYAGMSFASGFLANVCVYGGAFMAGKIIAEEAVALGFEVVEKQAAAKHAKILEDKAKA